MVSKETIETQFEQYLRTEEGGIFKLAYEFATGNNPENEDELVNTIKTFVACSCETHIKEKYRDKTATIALATAAIVYRCMKAQQEIDEFNKLWGDD